MSRYIQGNLAMKESLTPSINFRETKKTIYRKKPIPMQEKLLYIVAIIACVLVASAILWRYAQIYEMNTQIQRLQTKIEQLDTKNSNLKQEVSKLSDPQRLKNEAMKLGLVPAEGQQIDQINIQQGTEKIAINQ